MVEVEKMVELIQKYNVKKTASILVWNFCVAIVTCNSNDTVLFGGSVCHTWSVNFFICFFSRSRIFKTQKMGTHQFDLFCTSTIFISSTCLYFDSLTSTFCQIWTSYWSRSTGQSKVLVEVKLGQKSRSKVEEKYDFCIEIVW